VWLCHGKCGYVAYVLVWLCHGKCGYVGYASRYPRAVIGRRYENLALTGPAVATPSLTLLQSSTLGWDAGRVLATAPATVGSRRNLGTGVLAGLALRSSCSCIR